MSFPLTRSTTYDEALEHISDERSIWVRFGAVQGDASKWLLRMVELVSGTAPPSWEERCWEYPDSLFGTLLLSGARTSQSLRDGTFGYGNYVLELPQKLSVVQWERRQSRSQAPFETLEWPAVEATLSLMMGNENAPWGHLVSGGSTPSFLSFDSAAASFFGIELVSTNMNIAQGVVYRSQDLRGRIDSVQVRRETLAVTVDGSNLGELDLELASDVPGVSKHIEGERETSTKFVQFDLADGLPSGSWLLLRKGGKWIDRRFLSVPYARGSQAGVEIVVEAGTKLEALVAGGERQYVEYKRHLPTSDESKRGMMKTVAAFANGLGGSILIGVDDDRDLVGLEPSKIGNIRDQVTQMIGSWIEPWPPVDFEILPMLDSEKVVLEILVGSGFSLYGCGRPGEIRTPYVRHIGVTEKASVTEIENIVRMRTPQNSNSSIFG